VKMPLVALALLFCCTLNAQQQTNQTQYPSEIYLGRPAPSTSKMTVADVVKLSKAGAGDDLILQQLSKRGGQFNLSTEDIVQLKKAGVSDRVVGMMVDPSGPPQMQAPTPQQKPIQSSSSSALANSSGASLTAVADTSAAPRVTAPQAAPQPAATTQALPSSIPAAAAKVSDGKVRVYVTDRPITEVVSMIQGGSYGSAHASGYANGTSASYTASAQQASHVSGIRNDQRGGADPRTLEVSGDIGAECTLRILW
jgi:hypothetical protein